MGLGDQLIATGLAKGYAARGKKLAFGTGQKIIWDHNSEKIFRGNPNIAFPGDEGKDNLEWFAYYKGLRHYNTAGNGHWLWNMRWKCTPGEIYLTDDEKDLADRKGKGFVVIEPNIETWKSVAPNKDWGMSRYEAVANALKADGYEVVQFTYPSVGITHIARGVRAIKTATFREALAILRNASLYLGPEGGLHHGAAAVGVRAVVLFGGFIPPSVTGYDDHINLVGNATRFCGSFTRCNHCIDALSSISTDVVYRSAREILKNGLAEADRRVV